MCWICKQSSQSFRSWATSRSLSRCRPFKNMTCSYQNLFQLLIYKTLCRSTSVHQVNCSNLAWDSLICWVRHRASIRNRWWDHWSKWPHSPSRNFRWALAHPILTEVNSLNALRVVCLENAINWWMSVQRPRRANWQVGSKRFKELSHPWHLFRNQWVCTQL